MTLLTVVTALGKPAATEMPNTVAPSSQSVSSGAGNGMLPASTTPIPKSRWAEIEAATGQMALDGSLRCRFSLGETREMRLLRLRLELEHQITTDAFGHAQSSWIVRGVRTSLAPIGRTHLLWVPPSGPQLKFELAKIGRALSDAGPARWRIREARPAVYEIRADDGISWTYQNGRLVRATHPALGELAAKTQGGYITELRLADAAPGAPPLLKADFDSTGALMTLCLSGHKPHQFAYGPDGHLESWTSEDGAAMHFTYSGKLLAAFDGHGMQEQLSWAANPGYGRGDSRWPSPVHLASDNENRYEFDMESRGFVLRRTEIATGRRVLTYFNPRRSRVEQMIGNDGTIVTFRRSGAARGRLEQIQDRQGVILEEYGYDDAGQLALIRRKGEPERRLTYDDLGRLMDISTDSGQ